VLGTGDAAIEAALLDRLTVGVAVVALVAKLLATLATVGSGGSAGLLVPSLFFGTMVATALAPLSGYAAPMLIVPAITASLVSLVNVPLAAILFTVEAFGSPYMIPALVALVVAFLLALDHSIYRTQRETYEYRQILPGFSVRRVPVPAPWDGKTLVELQVRRRFGINVIGLIQPRVQQDRMGYQTTFDPSRTDPLSQGDTLIVLGEDGRLDVFEAALNNE
jgi:CIC family chloride channel protein